MSKIITQSDYTSALVSKRNDLADNIDAKGVDAERTEKLNSLVPKVLEIPTGGDEPTKIDSYYLTYGFVNYGTTDKSGATQTNITVTCNTNLWEGTALLCVFTWYPDLLQFDLDGFQRIGSNNSGTSFYIKTYTSDADVPRSISVKVSFSDNKARWLSATLIYLKCATDVELYDTVNHQNVTSVTYTPTNINFEDAYSLFYFNEKYQTAPTVNKSYFEVHSYSNQWAHFISPKNYYNYYGDGSPTITVNYGSDTSSYACFTQIKFKCMYTLPMKYAFGYQTSTFWNSVQEYLLPNLQRYGIDYEIDYGTTKNSIILKNGDSQFMIIEGGTTSAGRVNIKLPYGSSSWEGVNRYLLGMYVASNGNIIFQFDPDITPDSYFDAAIVRTKQGKNVLIYVRDFQKLYNNSQDIFIADGVTTPNSFVYYSNANAGNYYQLIHIQVNGKEDCLATAAYLPNVNITNQHIQVINGKKYFPLNSFFIGID